MEENYDIGKLLAVKAALEEWRHWLEGVQHPVTVLTDHRNLEYIRQAQRFNPRQSYWVLFTCFHFQIAQALKIVKPMPYQVSRPTCRSLYGPGRWSGLMLPLQMGAQAIHTQTHLILSCKYWWPRIMAAVSRAIKSRSVCAMLKVS